MSIIYSAAAALTVDNISQYIDFENIPQYNSNVGGYEDLIFSAQTVGDVHNMVLSEVLDSCINSTNNLSLPDVIEMIYQRYAVTVPNVINYNVTFDANEILADINDLRDTTLFHRNS